LARILSIDYGMKRCGIAVTDPLQLIVNGLTTVSQPDTLNFVIDYCLHHEVSKIVIGYPLQPDGTNTPVTMQVQLIKSQLEKAIPNIQIEFFDEKMSSKQAMDVLIKSGIGKKKRSDKALLDKMSAVIILQRYLGHI
jgi:putative Holliday junction resolvase